ncbi:hypothetical protein [Rubrivivax gelatinosus]|uniref:hypothetical protein n=1 Tax=Rubrivivax gelatinosus TaxID=28068 RepID=UPI001908DA74|nr:hypothetical protein [Rubrivivax gelatinosus]
MPRRTLLQFLLALTAGCLLLWLAIFIVGVLAALPTPSVLRPLVQGRNWLAVTLHSVLLVHIPMAFIAGSFALAVFRLLRTRGLPPVVGLTAPWLLYCLFEAFNFYQEAQFPSSQKLALLLAWYTWFGRLSVPLGIWAASKLPVARAASAA